MLWIPSVRPLLLIITVLLILNLMMTSIYIVNTNLLMDYVANRSNGSSSIVRQIKQFGYKENDSIPTSKRDLYNQCEEISNDEAIEYFGNVTSSMTDWTFKNRIPCPTRKIGDTFTNKSRRIFSIQCSPDAVYVHLSGYVNSSKVQELEFGDICLNRFIQKCCLNEQRVPNVVHYVWYRRGELSFVPFLSLLGVIRFVKPCVIVFHGTAPYGKYWDAFTYFWPRVVVLKREAPTEIFNKTIQYKEHASDYMRIEALINYGGIYMDTDTVLVKPINELRNYSCVMSQQSSGLMGSAFVMSEKNGTFVNKWMDGYRYKYVPTNYIYNAMVYPKYVKMIYGRHIHVEYGTISRPNGLLAYKIYLPSYANYDWSHIYGIHFFIRLSKRLSATTEYSIRHLNSVFGSIARHVYFGSKELCL